MKESFLHFIWQNKKFDFAHIQTTCGKPIVVIDVGQFTQKSGPDFFNAKLIIDNQKWAGNVEMHCNSSDWFLHNHEVDDNYNNVILHVVWHHDSEVFSKGNLSIPVLEIKHFTPPNLIYNYENLFKPKTWINCESQLQNVSDERLLFWFERLYIERLEKKSLELVQLLEKCVNDWEATFFFFLAKGFGLNTNGELFYENLLQIPYAVIRKEKSNLQSLEALFLGSNGLLENEIQDRYGNELKSIWIYLKQKYNLSNAILKPEFFKHRPDNFPTIRLVQLASLIHEHQFLFDDCMNNHTLSFFYSTFNSSVSDYWKTHYLFDKVSKHKNKLISNSFIDLLLLNVVLPVKFAFQMHQGNSDIDQITQLAFALKPEANTIVSRFKDLGIEAQNSLESQALLQLKKEYCVLNKCLNCVIGQKLINFTT